LRPGRLLPIGAGLVLLTAVLWAARGRDADDAGWTEVKRDSLVLEVEVTGELKAVDSSFLGPPPLHDVWDFKIAFLAPEGSQVRAGQPVMAFDASELERRLEEKRAEADAARKRIEKEKADADLRRRQDALRLEEARARARKAELQVDVPEALLASNDLAKARLELEEAREEIASLGERMAAARRAEATRLGALERQLAAADRRVRETRESIDRMSVVAPRDGTVVPVSNWRDEKKKVGDSVWRGERILEIPDLRAMMARGEVAEADAGRVAVGQRVRLKLDAHPDVAFHGTIASIWSTVQERSWRDPIKVVRLDVDLDSTDPQRMRPGMRFRGGIEVERVERAVVVPADAVFLKEAGPVAFRRTAFGWERRPVRIGRRSESLVEVLEGVREGDRVARVDLELRESGGGA
jgi:multidrug efflux pump subunit AcrA (membrane-fusion protein)